LEESTNVWYPGGSHSGYILSLNKGSIGMILSKYGIPSLTVSAEDIKNLM